ncbi:MAG: MBL fold metallo-hydrolase, partial [Gallionellaceae bacterium]|nr:MBL fold metallo-hydrolase [Gallionellaceae bacterium]
MKFIRVFLTVCLAAFSFAAFAAAPMVKMQAPGFYRTMIGDFEVTALSDGTVPLPMDTLLNGISRDDLNKALAHHHLSLPLETSVNGFLINTGEKLILIDAGAGSFFGPTVGKLAANLKASGYQPEQVDEIYLTHPHPDHLGGLIADGQRVFPNALVRLDQKDADFAMKDEKMGSALKPYMDAGMFKAYNGDTELAPGIRVVNATGHTPGHSVYQFESKGQKFVAMGDLIHVAAIQFDTPSVAV